MRILIKNANLWGENKDIFLKDGTIEKIGKKLNEDADKVIEASGKIALPSFINGHTHAAMTIFRGYADDMPLRSWLEEKIWVLESKLTEEDVYWGAKLACLEMIKNGITVFNDMYWHFEATAQAVCEMGLRGFLSAVFIDLFDGNKAKEQIDLNLRLFESSRKYRPNVIFTLGPHAIYSVSKESLEWIANFSKEENLLIHMHLSETKEEVEFSKAKYGLSPVQFLDSIGMLSENFIGCHGCWIDEKDCEILGERRAKLVHMPISNMKLATGRLIPHHLLRKHGINYCLGTDGCASNNVLDMFETMKFASLLAKFIYSDPTILPAKEVYELATVKAAYVFGLGDWEIKEGSRTDIILLDPKGPEFVPNFDTYSDLVYSIKSCSVDTVICMGKVLMEKKVVEKEEEICENARRIAYDIVKRATR